MQNNSWNTLLFVLLIAFSDSATAADWQLKDFPYRRKIRIDTTDPDCKVAHVKFSHFGQLKPDSINLRVTDSKGAILRYEVLRVGPGDQAEILFDTGENSCKTGTEFYLYFGATNAVSVPDNWHAEAGVVLEVRKLGQGNPENWAGFETLLANSKEILGRTLRTRIFDGYNPIGPNEYYISLYRSYFRVAKDKIGRYEFATNSDDASFLFINGKKIAEYPGWHGAECTHGEHRGAIELTEGVHKLEYYHVQGGGESVTTAGWKRPGDKHIMLMDENAFIPIAQTKILTLDRADGKPTLDFSWTPHDHISIGGRSMSRYNFESSSSYTGTLRWDFSDGIVVTRKKDKLNHVETHGFIAPGTYNVTLSTSDGSIPPLPQTVVIEPVWAQRETWNEKTWQEYRSGIVAHIDAGTIKPESLSALLAFTLTVDDDKLLEIVIKQVWSQRQKFTPTDHAIVFFTLGMRLQSDLKQYSEADRAFQEVSLGTGEPKIIEQAKLHRAGLLIHMFGKNQEAFPLLKTLDDSRLLSPNEPILKQIFLADAYAGLGERAEALKIYETLQPNVNMSNRLYALSRRARLLTISNHIRTKNYAAALKELQNIEWETPTERLGDETGLLRADCLQAQGDFDLAVILLQRLIKVNDTSARLPEMLYQLMKAYKSLKRMDEVKILYTRLKKEHPYAAETALAAWLLDP